MSLGFANRSWPWLSSPDLAFPEVGAKVPLGFTPAQQAPACFICKGYSGPANDLCEQPV